MELLKRFYEDEHTREAVEEFFNKELEKLALEKIFSGQEISGIKDAKKVIERSFVELKELYGKDKESKSTNQAR